MSTQSYDYWWIEEIFLGEMNPRPTGFVTTDQDEFDVVVVGTGMAGFTAAIHAHDAGHSVIMLEAADEVGGTTYKSGAGMWVPDNHLMHKMGVKDDRDFVLDYMVKIAHPDLYDPEAERYGATEWQWEKITTYYDNAATAMKALVDAGGLKIKFFPSFTENYPAMASYHYADDHTIQGYYRHLVPMTEDGKSGIGHEMIAQLAAAAKERGIELRTGYRATGLVQDGDVVVGVTADTADGEKTLYARKGVVFATGGFPHGAENVAEHFRGPLYSSCAVPTARGDFIQIGLEAGAELAGMRNGWLYEDLLEKAAPDRVAMEGGINVPSGDSMIYVDTTGNRYVNEKAMYQERAPAHWEKDDNGEFPRRVTFMVFDDFVAQDTRPWLFLDTFQSPKPWIIEGATLEELAANVQDRLNGLTDVVGEIKLTDDWASQLGAQIQRFNGYAAAGKDEEFSRGEQMQEFDWNGPAREGWDGNPTMHPFAEDTRYYCVLIIGMVLDTNGGPKTNRHSQVLRADGSVIEGLYGSGNCVAAVAGDGYLSGGSTLGPATTFSYLAVKHLNGVSARDLSAVRGAAV